MQWEGLHNILTMLCESHIVAQHNVYIIDSVSNIQYSQIKDLIILDCDFKKKFYEIRSQIFYLVLISDLLVEQKNK